MQGMYGENMFTSKMPNNGHGFQNFTVPSLESHNSFLKRESLKCLNIKRIIWL